MKVRNATPEELVAEGVLTPEDVERIEANVRYIEEHDALPPAEKVTIREVGRPLTFGEPLTFMGFRVTEGQRKFVDAYAAISGQSRSHVMRDALDMYRRAHESELQDA